MLDTSLDRKSIMYNMIRALESDFIDFFAASLMLDDIPTSLLERSNRVEDESNVLLSYLMGLDIQAYIEICNANIDRLHITADQKTFLNKEVSKLILIRNRVMHPRPLEITDYPILEAVSRELIQRFNQHPWTKLVHFFYVLENDPTSLQIVDFNVKKSDNIIENLPTDVDYEETSFIGRRREVGEVKAQLNRKNVHVLSIIGDGGVGKTALALKLLYDMLDDDSCKFELILWVSLKTSQLSGYEFKKIEDSITSTAQMYAKLGSFVAEDEICDVPNYLIDLAKEFNTLLVLDNLETINTEEVKGFIDAFSEYGKVLITSRIGLGEMEHRYPLSGFNDTDVLEYMNALLNLYGFPGLYTEEMVLNIAQRELHSNPLAIKWFVKSLHNGKTTEEILAHKDDLVFFCMSNVYDKLTADAKAILETIQILKVDLSVGEVFYYNDLPIEEYVNISYAINELIKCNFLDQNKYKRDKKLSITTFASEFLMSQISPNRDKTVAMRESSKALAIHKQRLDQKRYTEPLSSDTFFFYGTDSDRLVATFYLTEAVKAFNQKRPFEDVRSLVEIANKIAPDYSEVASIFGFIYADSSPDKARTEHDRAIAISRIPAERAIAHAKYARFLRSNNMYLEAVNHLEQAVALDSENDSLKFELIMSLCWVNNFKAAKDIFEGVDFDTLQPSLQHEYAMRYSDMRRREAQEIAQCNAPLAFQYLKEAFEILEKDISNERRKYDSMANILSAMSYLYLDDSIVDYILEKLQVYYNKMRPTTKYKRFQEVMSSKLSVLSKKQQEKLIGYILDAKTLLNRLGKNQGIVVVINPLYGLFKVDGMEASIYFKRNDKSEHLVVGDIIHYDKLTTGSKGLVASSVKRVSSIVELVHTPE